MTYIGIDPGKNGALAVIYDDGTIFVTPYDKREYAEILGSFTFPNACRVCLEHVGAMPGQGVSSMFTFGQYFGEIQGMLEANKLPYQLVRPQRWKKEYGISNKNESIAVCKRLFPGISLLRTDKSRKYHDGMAEALLMAEYARRKL